MIHIVLPFFPPSSNNAYFTRGNLRVLKKEGVKFKREVQNFLGKEHPEFLQFFASKDKEYEVVIRLVFAADELYSKTWLKKEGVRRHKKNDATNRIKLLEDVLVDATGHDDAQHASFTSTKTEAMPGHSPYVEIWAWGEEESDGPVTQFLARALAR